MTDNVKPLRAVQSDKPVLHDVPGLLRNIAENIENGFYGDTKDPDFQIRCALVIRVSGKPPQLFGLGQTQVAQTYMDLMAGAQELMNMGSPAITVGK